MMDEDKVLEFISFTRAEPHQAHQFLADSGGDVAKAVAMYFEGSQCYEVEDRNVLRPPMKPAKRRLVRDDSDDDEVVAVYPRGRETRPNWSHVDYAEVFGDFSGERQLDTRQRSRTLADLFRPPSDILYMGAFNEAKSAAAAVRKYLIVNIQDQSLFDSQKLNRDTWSSAEVRNLIQSKFLIVQYYRDSRLASNYVYVGDADMRGGTNEIGCRKWYSIEKMPHVAVIDGRTGERLAYWEGFIGPEELEIELRELLKDHPFEQDENVQQEFYELSDCDYDYLDEDAQLAAAIEASMKNEVERNDNTDEIRRDFNPLIHLNGESAVSTGGGFGWNPSGNERNSNNREGGYESGNYEIGNAGKNVNFVHKDKRDDNGEGVISANQVFVDKEDGGDFLKGSEKNSESDKNRIYRDPHVDQTFEGDPDCTLLIRLPNGKMEKKQFHGSSRLSSTAAFVSEITGKTGSEFVLVTSFPRKVYSKSEWPNTTLKEASLCPRAVIIVEEL